MGISAADVSKLRNMTGAGMMDSKNALVEAEGDFDLAIDILRKKGQKVAGKRADRESLEGAVIAKVSADNKKGVIISLNCETDFVSKNADFVELANELAEKALAFSDKESFLASDFGGQSVSEKLIEQTGVIGEKIEIANFQTYSSDFVGFYIHAGNKIASLVGLSINDAKSTEVSKNVSMQVAAMSPIALNESQVDQETIDKEIEIAKDVLRQEGKPEDMLDKIAKGKLSKFFKDNTLINQEFIKESKVIIKDYVSREIPGCEITGFKRVSL